MNIEEVRAFALSLTGATEDMFAENWLSFRIGGKWFMLMQLDAPEPRVAVKLQPDIAMQLREENEGITPAYHLNKKHWSDLYLQRLETPQIEELITQSYNLVVSKLPKSLRP